MTSRTPSSTIRFPSYNTSYKKRGETGPGDFWDLRQHRPSLSQVRKNISLIHAPRNYGCHDWGACFQGPASKGVSWGACLPQLLETHVSLLRPAVRFVLAFIVRTRTSHLLRQLVGAPNQASMSFLTRGICRHASGGQSSMPTEELEGGTVINFPSYCVVQDGGIKSLCPHLERHSGVSARMSCSCRGPGLEVVLAGEDGSLAGQRACFCLGGFHRFGCGRLQFRQV